MEDELLDTPLEARHVNLQRVGAELETVEALGAGPDGGVRKGIAEERN